MKRGPSRGKNKINRHIGEKMIKEKRKEQEEIRRKKKKRRRKRRKEENEYSFC